MTESDWLDCANPEPMLEFLGARASARKMRLLACACCRRVLPLMLDARSRAVVEIAERLADGQATPADLSAVYEGAMYARDEAEAVRLRSTDTDELQAAYAAAIAAHECSYDDDSLGHDEGAWRLVAATCSAAADARHPGEYANSAEEETAQAVLVRDVFGNPFRPVALDSLRVTPAVSTLVGRIYDERTFDRMPELADVLEGAGCSYNDILAHCREPGLHVRGCWVVDLLLGKK